MAVVMGLAIVGFFIDAVRGGETGRGSVASGYRRKEYLFDSNSEFRLYHLLMKLYANQFHIFAQVNYNHLLEPKSRGFVASRAGRSRIDRKSADFVLCELDSVVPLLVIELDGSAHSISKKRERDTFIDKICTEAGLPILHLEVGAFDEATLKALVDAKITPKVTVE